MSVHIFGYGSLLNPASRRDTFDELEVLDNVVLKGYRRVLNACHESFAHIALNLAEEKLNDVKGVVVEVCDTELSALKDREVGYDLVEVTNNLSVGFDVPVYTFIMSNPVLGNSVYQQSYMDLCLAGVPEGERDIWIKETLFPFGNKEV